MRSPGLFVPPPHPPPPQTLPLGLLNKGILQNLLESVDLCAIPGVNEDESLEKLIQRYREAVLNPRAQLLSGNNPETKRTQHVKKALLAEFYKE